MNPSRVIGWLMAIMTCLSTLPHAVAAEALPTMPANVTKIPAFKQANFHQERHIAALTRPLISSGQLIVKTNGVVWQQTNPFAVSLHIRSNDVIEEIAGKAPRKITAKENPYMMILAKTFSAALTGDLNALYKTFEVTSVSDSNRNSEWRIRLVPLDPAIKSAIASLQLTGAEYLTNIRVDEASGNYTEIELSNFVTSGH